MKKLAIIASSLMLFASAASAQNILGGILNSIGGGNVGEAIGNVLSSVTGAGFDALDAAVAALFPAPPTHSETLLTNARQADAASRALTAVRAALDALRGGMTPDVVLTETESASNALGELTGRTARDDMVARIFERFCVGK